MRSVAHPGRVRSVAHPGSSVVARFGVFAWLVAIFLNPMIGMPVLTFTPVGFIAGGLFKKLVIADTLAALMAGA